MRHETFLQRSTVQYWLLLIAILSLPARSAQGDPDPTDDRLHALRVCLPAKYRGELEKLRNGLLWNWKPGGEELPPPAAAYLASLDQDIRACGIAAKLTDPKASDAIYSAIAKDIEIKASDCRKFGMGRMVTVHVKTMLGGAPNNGWQVLYKWVGASLLQGQEIPFPNMTSPATGELPPGVYVLRVEKAGAPTLGKSPQPLTIVVGSELTKEVEIPVQ